MGANGQESEQAEMPANEQVQDNPEGGDEPQEQQEAASSREEKNGDQHQEIACQEREEAETEVMQGENVRDQSSSWGNTEEHAENFSQDDNMRPEETRQEDYIRGTNYDEQD